MALLYLLVLLSTIVFLLHRKIKRVFKEVEHIPGPPLRPFLGNALEIGTNPIDMLRNFKRLSKRYGHVVRLCVGWKVIVLISDPKYILQVVKENQEDHCHEFFEHLRPLLGKGLFTLTGETWTKHRKILNRSFGVKHLEKYTKIFNANGDKLVGNLSKMVGPLSVDVTREVFKCGLNVVCNAVMQVDVSENIDFRKAADGVMDVCTRRFYSFLNNFDFFFRLTDDYKHQQGYMKTLDEFYEFVVAKHKSIAENRTATEDGVILDDLLNLKGEDAFTHEEIRGAMQTLIVAGSETIGSTLVFLMFELAQHPEVQEKILEETRQVMGPNKETDVAFEDVHQLKYTDCVVKETLRKYTPAYMVPKQLAAEVKLGDVTVPAGANVLLHLGAMHLSPDFYPDPEEFNPDRFLFDTQGDNNRAFMPFGAGSRMCLGYKFALLEAKVILVKLVRNFQLLPPQPEHPIVFMLEGVLKPADGVRVNLKFR